MPRRCIRNLNLVNPQSWTDLSNWTIRNGKKVLLLFFISWSRRSYILYYNASFASFERLLRVFKGKGNPTRFIYLLVTESEIRRGVLGEQHPVEQCLWISRNIQDLENHLQNDYVQNFIDIKADTKEIDTDAQQLLQVL